jgi:hypothetical protein
METRPNVYEPKTRVRPYESAMAHSSGPTFSGMDIIAGIFAALVIFLPLAAGAFRHHHGL